MGSSQSTRKLTIVNEEEEGNLIKISDAVAQRLSQSITKINDEPRKPTEIKAPLSKASAAMSAASSKTAVANQELIETYYPPFTVSALEVQQLKEKELAEQEIYWQQRLINLEVAHDKINCSLNQEYKKALSAFDDCRVIKVQGLVQPCIENRQKVLKCYTDNPKETLRCADLVEEFANCVDQRRAQIMKCN